MWERTRSNKNRVENKELEEESYFFRLCRVILSGREEKKVH